MCDCGPARCQGRPAPHGRALHEEAVGSLTDMPRTFLWNQSHTGFVDINENSFSIGWVHALQKVTPTPQRFRLITPQKTQKRNSFEQKSGRFLKPVCTWYCTHGLKNGAENGRFFGPMVTSGGKKIQSGRIFFASICALAFPCKSFFSNGSMAGNFRNLRPLRRRHRCIHCLAPR